MDEAISAADANRNFSRLLRGVREGRTYVVTSHGEPVAKIVRAGTGGTEAAAGRAALLKRLRSQKVHNVQWRRDELYDEAL